MESTPHRYEISVDENIVYVKNLGHFSEDSTRNYHNDMINVVDELKGTNWATLVTYQDNGLFTPEAELALIALTQYRAKHGMVANASIFKNSRHTDIQQMQLLRIYQAAKIPCHVFSDITSAKNWLDEFLADCAPENN